MKRQIAVILSVLLILPLFSAGASAQGDENIVRVGWVPRDNITEVSDGVYSGYNYDFLMEISNYTGWSYEFVVGELPEMTDMLASGEIDLLGSLLYSDEREQVFDFPQLPYGEKYTILFCPENSPFEAYDFASFDGMRIAALAGDNVSADNLKEFSEGSGFSYTLLTYDGVEALAAALSSGEADAAIVDSYINEPGFKILAEFSPVPYYFAVTEGSDEVLQGLNRALWQLNIDRPYIERELYDRHFGIHFDPTLTEAEQALVDSTKAEPIVVGVITSSPPACYLDSESGEYVGIFMELLKAVADKTGLCFSYVPLDLSLGSPIEQLKSGAPDLVAGVIKTERFMEDKSLALSDVLLSDSLVIVAHKGNDFTQNPESKTIAFPTGFQVAAEYVSATFPTHQIKNFDTAEDCLDAVASGRADAAIYTRTCMNFMLHDPHYEHLETIPAYYCDMNTCVAGLSSSSREIISIINKGLAMISDSERNSLIMDTTIANPYRVTVPDIIYKYRAAFIVISLLLLAVIVVLAVLNVTKRRNEEKLQAAFKKEQAAHEQETAALAVAERASAAKGDFMSRMSHEIRTPLNAVIGYNVIAKNALTSARTDAERRQADTNVMDCLTKSELASRHLLTVINDVLDMSAIESGKLEVVRERFDFKNLVSSLTVLFYSQAKAKNVDFSVLFNSPSEEWFVGDQMRINQILTNLLSNAVKFTPEGGSVKMRITPSVLDDKRTLFTFEIIDTGIGMEAEYLSRLWLPFEQADSSISRRFGGTGLGLSITKSLVDIMNGSISAVSRPGAGSTFTVELTLGRTDQPSASGSYDFSDVNALVVDDDESTCDYVKLLFDRCGARCSTVTSGSKALELFAHSIDRGDRFSLCLIDWRMPQMDGLATVKKLRELAGDDLPIIIITAYDYSEIADKVSHAGVTRFIAKPLFHSSIFDLLAGLSGAGAPSRESAGENISFNGARVLLAEDNKMNMEVASRLLESVGLLVDSAWNGSEAYELFESSPAGKYKAILMDVHMPGIDGYQATARIRASSHPEAASIPIIAMTADAFSENVAEAYAAGMNDHIAKPIDTQTLFSTLRKFIKP